MKPRALHVAFAWAASLIVHGGVTATLLQYYSPPQPQADLPVMQLVQLPVLITPPAPEPEPPKPLEPPPPKKIPPPVRRPKPVEVAEKVERAPSKDVSEAPAPPPEPAPDMQAMAEPAATIAEPEPILDLRVAYLENPQPAYPAVARRRGWEGTVVIQLMLDEDGQPHELQVYRSSGFAELDRSALESVRRWRFQPATRNGIAVAMPDVRVPIQFRLK